MMGSLAALIDGSAFWSEDAVDRAENSVDQWRVHATVARMTAPSKIKYFIRCSDPKITRLFHQLGGQSVK